MLVSIIIPTYKDWDRLLLCLKALEEQTFPASDFEIIVINNNPADLVPENYPAPANCQIVTEARPGSYAARNAGIRLAKGDIIGFTDSDCIPAKDWIYNAVDYLKKHKDVSRIAGNIELFFKSNDLTPAELYEKVYAFKQEEIVKSGLSVTGNMFTYKHVFDKVGIFNEELLSGGDYEWSKRASNAGFKIVYGHNVVIKHPARYKMSDLIKKTKRVVGGDNLSKTMAILDLMKNLKPPLRIAFHQIKKYGSDLSFSQKIKVYSIKYYLAITCSVEKIRISYGNQANRE
ncbi:glycosyltransferase family 2 protein [Dyadobacter flavalbus]|uniref:glycosyltransferase family 2 protein n=1 Tax=Dyadobacter flavalbus TaxID=2579942 RepID=UPI001375EF73|nr:glycosyltransferase family A protein [Dyadobacter flavalbus]